VQLVLAIVALALAAFQAPEKACPACPGTGRVPCVEHRSAELARESNAILCTFYAGCARCAGTGSIDCAKCEAASSVAGRAAGDLRAAAAKRFAGFQSAAGRPILAAASAHFDLVCELEPMKAQGKKRSQHELLHLYLDRLEEAYRSYLSFFALADADITARSQIFLWATKPDHEKIGQALCGYTTFDVEYKRAVEAITSLWFDGKKLKDDDSLHHCVVHQVVHGLMNAQPPVAWTGKLCMGWADEGLSLWFEDHLLGPATGFCFWLDEDLSMRSPIQRLAVHKLLEPGKTLDLERLLTLDTVDMTRDEQALGFSLIDYLAARDPALLRRLLERMRARTPSRDAFKEVYGVTLEELATSWKTWVAANYPAH
jgi:hypothetical protein